MSTKALPVRQEQLNHVRTYRIADSTLTVFADSVEADNLWAEFAPKYCLTVCPPALAEVSTGTIELYCQQRPPAVPAGLAPEQIEHGQGWIEGEKIWLEIAGAIIFISAPATNVVKIWVDPQTIGLEAVIAYALPSALRRRGFYELHAAGLIAPATNRGVLIIGDSGSGKSTLATRLASSGWSYLTDDLVLLQQAAKAVTAWGLRRVFALTDETLQACFSTQSHQSSGDEAAKQYLDPQNLFATTATASSQPCTLFFTELTQAAQTRIEAISSSAAMMGLLRQSSWLCYDPVVAHHHTQILTRLAQQCQAFRLYAGRDLLLQPKLADELLRSYLL